MSTQNGIDIKEISEKIEKESAFVDLLTLEMNKVIVGQKQMIERLLIGLLGRGHILLEGGDAHARDVVVFLDALGCEPVVVRVHAVAHVVATLYVVFGTAQDGSAAEAQTQEEAPQRGNRGTHGNHQLRPPGEGLRGFRGLRDYGPFWGIASRQLNLETRARGPRVRHSNGASVVRNDLLHDGQPQPRPPGLAGVEGLEDAVRALADTHEGFRASSLPCAAPLKGYLPGVFFLPEREWVEFLKRGVGRIPPVRRCTQLGFLPENRR